LFFSERGFAAFAGRITQVVNNFISLRVIISNFLCNFAGNIFFEKAILNQENYYIQNTCHHTITVDIVCISLADYGTNIMYEE
jgi:hypothetical protein